MTECLSLRGLVAVRGRFVRSDGRWKLKPPERKKKKKGSLGPIDRGERLQLPEYRLEKVWAGPETQLPHLSGFAAMRRRPATLSESVLTLEFDVGYSREGKALPESGLFFTLRTKKGRVVRFEVSELYARASVGVLHTATEAAPRATRANARSSRRPTSSSSRNVHEPPAMLAFIATVCSARLSTIAVTARTSTAAAPSGGGGAARLPSGRAIMYDASSRSPAISDQWRYAMNGISPGGASLKRETAPTRTKPWRS